MLRYKLRTLLIVLALGPPMLALGYWAWEQFKPRPPAGWTSDLIDLDLPHYGGGPVPAEPPADSP